MKATKVARGAGGAEVKDNGFDGDVGELNQGRSEDNEGSD